MLTNDVIHEISEPVKESDVLTYQKGIAHYVRGVK